MSTAQILEYARGLSDVELAALVSDLLDLQLLEATRRATARRTVVKHEVGV